jgi:hypothetical protein
MSERIEEREGRGGTVSCMKDSHLRFGVVFEVGNKTVGLGVLLGSE